MLHRHQTRLHNQWILQKMPGLTEAELKVYIVLAMHAHWEAGYCYPRMELIAKESGLMFGKGKDKPDLKRVRKAVRGLQEKGLIEVEFRKAKNEDGVEHGRKRYFYRLKHPANREYFAD